jgi:hypothetical protein
MDTLAYLAAKDAIAAVATRYCRGIDRCDADLVKSAYHPDAYDDHGTFKGNAWEFADIVTKSLRRYAATMHAIMNHSIDDVDVDAGTASGEIYVTAYHLRDTDAGRIVDLWWGRYLDDYTCRAGDWRIAKRICVHEWTMQLPIESAMPIAAELFRAGSFDRKV